MKKHIYYFDYLRVIAAISVIYMHVASVPLRSEINTNWHVINLFTSLGFTAVPLFFMMSGYLVLSDEKTLDVTVLLKKRLPHLVVPLIAYTLIAVFWKLLSSNSLALQVFYDELVSALSTPAWVHFWYMYTLIALYCLSPVLYGALHTLDRSGHIFVLSIIGLISVRTMLLTFLPNPLANLLNIDILNKLTFLGGHLSTFILGYYLGNLKRKIPNALLGVIALITLAAITLGTYRLTQRDGSYNQAFQNQASGFEIILAASIFLLFKQLCDRECRIFKLVPLIPLSLAIYLMHNILISILEHYGHISQITSFADTVFVTLVILVLSYLISKTLATVKLLCFPITGLSFKSACGSCNWIYTFKGGFLKNAGSCNRKQFLSGRDKISSPHR